MLRAAGCNCSAQPLKGMNAEKQTKPSTFVGQEFYTKEYKELERFGEIFLIGAETKINRSD